MFKYKKLVIALSVASSLVATNVLAQQNANPTNAQQTVQATAPQLIVGNWDAFNRDQLNKLIARHGKTNPNYNPNNPPYTVFDWDNTSVFLDIQEAVLIYQIEQLNFKMTPEIFNQVIRTNIPQDNFASSANNKSGNPVNIELIAQDLLSSYTWIYDNFGQMQGSKTLAQIKATDEYKEFSVKLRYLYESIGDSFDVSISYPWVTYLFAGMTEKDVRQMTVDTFDWQQTQPIEDVTWTSPSITSKAGQVDVTWSNGLRASAEMQDLYSKLREAGIDIWVCSASFIDVIKEISSNPKFGYNNPDTNAIAMELERDANGVILPEYRKGYTQTQGPGKTVEIKRLIAPKYGNRGPILVAADSEGDQNMIQDFKETEIGIIVNRLRSPTTDIGRFSKEAVDTYNNPNAKYLLQGRNENTGLYLPSQKTIKLGTTEERALR